MKEDVKMKIAIIGSRGTTDFNIGIYLPDDITEIVSGGARGIDEIAKKYAEKTGLKYTEFLPDYASFGKIAPLVRNDEIIAYSDEILAFWDGKSRGTKYVIDQAHKKGKRISVINTELL